MAKVDVAGIISDSFYTIRDYSTLVVNTFKDKGVKYFQLPLVVALFVLVFSFSFLKKPAGEAVRRDNRKIDSLKAQIKNVGNFTPNKLKMQRYESRLPPVGEKGEWLRTQLLNICRAQGVVPRSASPQSDALVGDYVVSDMTLVVGMPFQTLGELVAKIESNPKLLRVTSLVVTRDQLTTDFVTATLKVATVFSTSSSSTEAAPQP